MTYRCNCAITVAKFGNGVCRMKYFTEREFSGIFSLAEGGNLRLRKGNSRWPWQERGTYNIISKHRVDLSVDMVTNCSVFWWNKVAMLEWNGDYISWYENSNDVRLRLNCHDRRRTAIGLRLMLGYYFDCRWLLTRRVVTTNDALIGPILRVVICYIWYETWTLTVTGCSSKSCWNMVSKMFS